MMDVIIACSTCFVIVVLAAAILYEIVIPRPPALPAQRKGFFADECARQGIEAGRVEELSLGDGRQVDVAELAAKNQDGRPGKAQKRGPRLFSKRDAAETAVVAAPSAAFAAGTVYVSSQLDDSLLGAMQDLSGEQVRGVFDFTKVQGAENYDLTSIKLRGHIGEHEAARSLEPSGMEIAWPSASNNPGWDLTLDGNPVNVKVVQDASSLSEHFGKYPDIPVMLNADAENIPEGAIYFDPASGIDPGDLVGEGVVIVNEALSLSAVEGIQASADAVQGGAEGLTDVGDVIPGLTFVTAAVMSGVREGRLLSAGKTDSSRAMKNVITDTLGRGGGAAAGAAAGLAVDVATGGMTLGLGALVGAIIGGIGGGAAAKMVKLQPLFDAQARLQAELRRFEQKSQSVQRQAKQDQVIAAEGQRQLVWRRSNEVRDSYCRMLANLQKQLGRASTVDAGTAKALADQQAEQLRAAVFGYTSSAHAVGPLGGPIARLRARRARRAIEAWHSKVLQAGSSIPSAGVAPFFDYLAATPDGERHARAFINNYSATRRRVYEQALLGNRSMTGAIRVFRAEAVTNLRREQRQIQQKAKGQLQPALRDLDRARSQVNRELEMAGRA